MISAFLQHQSKLRVMALSTYVYISGVNNLSDARYCAGMGVDTLGFNVDPENENYTSSDKFSEITGWVAGVKLAGEFGNLDANSIKAIIPNYTLDFIVTSNVEALQHLIDLNIPIILEVNINQPQQDLKTIFEDLHHLVSYFIVKDSDDSDDALKSSVLTSIPTEVNILLGFGIQPENTRDLLDSHNIKGIALQGGNEIKPGYKDFDGLADILEVLEVDEGY